MTMRKLAAVDSSGDRDDVENPCWAEARMRLALYLQALELPEGDATHLLEQALSQARAVAPAVPLPAAMAAAAAVTIGYRQVG
jgi:hypothetical protein